ncbi:LuxR C-terminal-related transcriptional regulator [Kibdelosporangium aridum]|uniref:Two-component system, NarL family, response regulator DesR n=1 Tax=Kibdelosporangium aridum TaxID=2030 RepID=A0A1Y5XNM4_KIBAR|nr:two-component system, NarL family, response regulator DesR [Kibdelosporangium aridum]
MSAGPQVSPETTGYPATASGLIRVLLVVDMDLLRDALVTLLSEQHDMEVVADLKCDDNVIPIATRIRPDVAVIDVDQPCSRGLAMIPELRARLPRMQVVALAAASPPGLVQRALTAEVLGLVDKNASATRLIAAIRGAARGSQVVDVNLAVAALAAGPNPFTPRELQVLRLAADGASGPEIASRLSLSKGTVRNYLSKVMSKTCARTRIDAIRIVREAGWL